MSVTFSAKALAALEGEIAKVQSPARFAHTKGVVKEALRMAALYLPDSASLLHAAALLHDCTKEYGSEEQLRLLSLNGVLLREDERRSPATWHAMTAVFEIERRYSAFAVRELLSAVRWHTTARAGLTVTEAILYLSDVTEEGRVHPACVEMRQRFWGAEPEKMEKEERLRHLHDAVLASLCGVRDSVLAKASGGGTVSRETLEAIEDLSKNPLREDD